MKTRKPRCPRHAAHLLWYTTADPYQHQGTGMLAETAADCVLGTQVPKFVRALMSSGYFAQHVSITCRNHINVLQASRLRQPWQLHPAPVPASPPAVLLVPFYSVCAAQPSGKKMLVLR
jgi:hypothetical protein